MLSKYIPTETERYICDIYHHLHIKEPHDIDINAIGAYFNIDICYYSGRPKAVWHDNCGIILLSNSCSLGENRLIFFHELAHILRHVGHQDELPKMFRDLQEQQASTFQRYAAMPYYLLTPYLNDSHSRTECINALAGNFHVTHKMASERLEQIKRRIESYEYQEKITSFERRFQHERKEKNKSCCISSV